MTEQNYRLGRSGEYVILALYGRGPMHGYDVKKAVAEIMDEDLSTALTYSTLGRLMEMGLIELTEEAPIKSLKGPPKKVYKLTGPGELAASAVRDRYEAIVRRVAQPAVVGV